MEEPKVAQKAPFVEKLQPGKYAWCSCGHSAKQPYCDGSHKGTGYTPVIEEIKEEKTVAWCGCKKTGNKPYCDGTHRNL